MLRQLTSCTSPYLDTPCYFKKRIKDPEIPRFAKAKEVQAKTQGETIAPHLLLPQRTGDRPNTIETTIFMADI
jgi:hypothetical protein